VGDFYKTSKTPIDSIRSEFHYVKVYSRGGRNRKSPKSFTYVKAYSMCEGRNRKSLGSFTHVKAYSRVKAGIVKVQDHSLM
jgi:hypothetical protein